MGKQPAEENKPPEEEEEEDTPLIKQLKELDNKYLDLEREYEREERLLREKFTQQQKPLLDKRLEVLKTPASAPEDAEAGKLGTPAVKGFWAQALHNHEDVAEYIQEWDIPVLEYLQNIVTVPLSKPEEVDCGFRLEFHFIENPYFEETLLTKEYRTEESSPYTGEIDVKEIKACAITWKSGKDVTVEIVKKKVKGGGAKKAKQAKEKEQPRESFFRNFFVNLKEGEPIPDSIDVKALKQEFAGMEDFDDEEVDDDDERLVGMLMENDHSCGDAIQKNVIPFAVRWYTGEANPEDSDEEEEDEEEDDDDDDEEDDDEDDDSEEEEVKPAKGSAKSKAKAKAKAEAKEECKQQ